MSDKQPRRFKLLKDLPDAYYSISENGSIYSKKTNRYLKPYIANGYLWVTLRINKKPVNKGVHRLIAEMFIPNPQNFPIVRHLNDNGLDNRLKNLAWGTKSDNMFDAINNGLIVNRPSPKGEKNRKAKLTEQKIISIRNDIKSGVPYPEISTTYGISLAYISNIKAKRAWKHIA